MTLRRLAVRVAHADAETARARLLELAPDGFEERARSDEVELAVFSDDPADEERLRAAFGAVAAEPVAPDWREAWKRFHVPVVVAGLWIGPPWEDPPEVGRAVVIDPGLAFGTGAHPTTRLCIELLAGSERGSLLDVGCGSGVVAIAAARLGYAPLVAVDVDPDAVEATRRNAVVNGAPIAIRRVDALVDDLPPTDVAVANIALEAVERIGSRLACGRLVTSGYFASERPRLPQFRHLARLTEDGWAADSYERE